jgi:hypothetical protein
MGRVNHETYSGRRIKRSRQTRFEYVVIVENVDVEPIICHRKTRIS